MNKFCDYNNCKEKAILPYICKFCHKAFCSIHRLPEDHNCSRLPKSTGKPPIYIYPSPPKHHLTKVNPPKINKPKPPTFFENIKYFLKSRYYKIKYFLLKRNHHKYTNWSSFFMNILWLFLLSLLFAIIYYNIEQLNKIKILFIPLGLTLLVIAVIIWIRFLFNLLKKIKYWFKGERNFVRYFILIVLILLALYGYNNKETLFNPVLYFYDSINFTRITSINLEDKYSSASMNNDKENQYEYSLKEDIKNIFIIEPERKEECKQAFDYLNNIRENYEKNILEWDDKLYDLAVFRAKEMYGKDYFDHVTPEGKCVKDFQSQFGISSEYVVAENLGGMSYYSKGSVAGNCQETVDGWLTSRGHRYNLLYDENIKGAIGCYYEVCVFLGLHQNPYGLGAGSCTTGEEGLAYWENVPRQEGEV